jgi:hypothetical protein
MTTRTEALDRFVVANIASIELIRSLLPYQREAVLSSSSHKAILATRRAGKSHACCVALIVKALSRPGATCHYLALTRASAKRIAWKVLKALCRTHKINAEFSESELVVTFPNDASINLYGVNQENLLDNLRGTPIDLAVLDEAASYRGGIVEELIEEVLEPAFADHDGSLMLIGTPSPVCAGYFYKATTGQLSEYENFKWDIRNNPHVAKGDPKGWLERHRLKKGWSLDNPTFQREYCGEWVQGSDLRVYQFNAFKNVGTPPFKLTHHVLGVDLGYRDDSAFVVLGFNPDVSANVYVVHQFSKAEMQLSQVAETIQTLMGRYAPYRVVIDEGGLGKSIAEDFRTRLGLPCQAAQKSEKRAHIEQMNSEMFEGRVFLPSVDCPLALEMLNLVWTDAEKKEEDPRLSNHLVDAALYAWRETTAYTFKPKPPAETKTPLEEVDEFFQRKARSIERRRSSEWWEN